MSAVITWLAEGAEGSDSPEQRTHVRTATLLLDPDQDTALTTVGVLQAAGVPDYGDAHPNAPALKVVRKSARNLGNGFEWQIRVEYEYSSPTAKSGKGRTPTSPTVAEEIPTDEPWEISQDYMDLEIAPDTMLEVDGPGGADMAAANPSVNTAGEAFKDPVTETISCNVIILEKNLLAANMSPSAAESYQGSVNSAQIVVAGITIGKRCGLMRRCAVQKRYYVPTAGGVPTAFWRLRVEIVIYPATLTTDVAVLQQGYNESDGQGGHKVIHNEDGTPARVPQLLNEDGEKTETSYFRYFARTKRVAWAGLNLPAGV